MPDSVFKNIAEVVSYHIMYHWILAAIKAGLFHEFHSKASMKQQHSSKKLWKR